MNEKQIFAGLELLESEFGKEKVKKSIHAVMKFQVEIPGWIFGDFGGGRFAEYSPPGCARNIYEKLDDAAFVNKLNGATECVATHVLWDFSEDGVTGSYKIAESVCDAAKERGLKIGSVSPTYFLKGSYRGSLAADERETRERYIGQTVLAGKIAKDFGGNLVTLWLPDGSQYPGQVDMRRAMHHLRGALEEVYTQLDDNVRLLIEYKLFEPGTYSTVLSDWGSAYMMAKNLGSRAGVLVDLGHHPHATNIEQIVARLIDDGMRCGFHFNTRYAADDDHAVEPNNQIARIFYELAQGDVVINDDPVKNWDYMIDQCSSRENRMHAILHSVDTLQHALAGALLVDNDRLMKYQQADEIILANRVFNDALVNADVRPIVAAARLEKNLPLNPLTAYVESGYQNKIVNER